MSSSSYPVVVLVALELVSFSGIVSNLLSLWYITKHFNLKKTVFFLLLVDAAVSLAACVLAFSSVFVLAASSALASTILQRFSFSFSSYSSLPCTTMALSVFMGVQVGLFAMMEISVIRFYSLRLSLHHLPPLDEPLLRRRCLLLLLFPCSLYTLSIVAVCAYNNVPYFKIVETCLHGDEAVLPDQRLHLSLYVPNGLVMPAASLLADLGVALSLRRLKANAAGTRVNVHRSRRASTANTSSSSPSSSFDTIPVRATLLSATTLLAALFVVILIQISGVSKLTSATTGLFVGVLTLTLRCPAVTMASFEYKSNQENLSNRLAREKRLRKVLEDARVETEMRRSAVKLAAAGGQGRQQQRHQEQDQEQMV